MASVLQVYTITEYLDHTWTDELVGFPLTSVPAAGTRLAIADEKGALRPCQVSLSGPTPQVWFTIYTLPALGTREYRLVALEADEGVVATPPVAERQGDTLELRNGQLAIRVPAQWQGPGTPPAPILACRRGQGPWLGQSTLTLSPAIQLTALSTECLESGPLFTVWRLRYTGPTAQSYTVWLTLHAHGPQVEVREESFLGHASHWELNLQPGLSPTHFTTHRFDPRPLPLGQHTGRHEFGALQHPVYSGIWVPDDFYYAAFYHDTDERGDCVALSGINGGYWDYPYENQLSLACHADGAVTCRMSLKAGHRAWLLLLTDRRAVLNAEPKWASPIHHVVKQYETPLHKLKDWVLDWAEVGNDQRPVGLANRTQIAEARERALAYPKLRDYAAALDPDLPGDYTYYHAGTHRVFKDDYRNDPAVCYLMAASSAERKKHARQLKDVILSGLRNRREAMIKRKGHVDNDCASINLGRGLRPWAALYDFAASEGVFSKREQRLVRATFAFFAYKISDPDFWPADHLTLRDDHPRSAHRTHWFPGRQSDWSFYNIDNLPHNFHGDLWSALGCIAMVFPRHPHATDWLDRTLGWWEQELTYWVFPEGAWLESSTYTLNSMKDYLIYCRMLHQRRIRDYFTDERFQRIFRCVTELMGPHDARIGGRTLPVIGDGSYPNTFCYVLGWMAGLSQHDPAFSALMSYAWKSTGEYLTEPGRFGLNFCDFLFIDASIPPAAPPVLGSKWYHGLGAVLRHAQGTPEEIWLFIKGGIIYSHFHEPEGTFQLWWRSQPLCDEYGVQYGSDAAGKSTSEPSCHNCIEIPGHSAVYNKGDLTTFVTTPEWDLVVVEAPILLAYLAPGQGIWGFQGEMGPAGWHRRAFLLVKPYYLLVHDDLECPHPSIYHLQVKAERFRQDGARVHFDGRYGTDLEFALLQPGTRELQFEDYEAVQRGSLAFKPPPKFYHQMQVHIPAGPSQGYATVLAPHPREVPVTIQEDEETGGARLRYGSLVDRAMLFAKPRVIASPTLRFRGTAGVWRQDGERIVAYLAAGNELGQPGRLLLQGDGPLTAELGGDGVLHLRSRGLARWVTISGPALSRAIRAPAEKWPLERLEGGAVRLYLPAGEQQFQLRP